MKSRLICGDLLVELPKLKENSVDLVFGSPPYEDARDLKEDPFPVLIGQDWVDWMVQVYIESLRVCKGLVAFVVQGRTKKFRWSATPCLLAANLHRAGIHLRDPIIYNRVGIPGSGSVDWLRHDCEYILCATNGGRLPWSDNLAMGENYKREKPGGPYSYRNKNGIRVHRKQLESYKNKRANPGNLVSFRKHGGGNIGNGLAHKNEAPFPEALAEFVIRSFCPPNGVVLDPYSGSGTTAAVAKKTGRHFIAIDIRESQIRLTKLRLTKTKV